MDETTQPLEELIEQEQPATQQKPARKLPLRKIIIFGAILAGAAAAAYAAAEFLAPAPGKQGDAGAPRIELPPVKQPETPNSPPAGVLHSLDSIIVNLQGSEGRRYLKITIAFNVKDQKMVEKLRQESVLVTDKLIMLLSSKKIEEIDGFDRKTELKREIRDEVNAALGIKDAITQVFFSELIVQ